MTERTVWKYAMPDRFCIRMPVGAQPLTVQIQQGEPHIWALVDPGQPDAAIWFRIAGAGHPIEDRVERYLGTFQLADGALIFHVFEIAPLAHDAPEARR
jgi:hypothetical protein